MKERIAGTGKLGLKSGKDGLKVGGQFAKGGLKMGKDKLSENLKSLRKNSPLVDSLADKAGSVKNRFTSMKEKKNASVNSLKEKGNKALAKLYGVRANAFREGSDDRKLLKGKQKLRDKEAKKYASQKNASREAVQRLKEERAKKREQRFKEDQERNVKQRMQTSNSRIVSREKVDVENPGNKKEKRLKARRKVDI